MPSRRALHEGGPAPVERRLRLLAPGSQARNSDYERVFFTATSTKLRTATTTEDLAGWIAGRDEAFLAIDLDLDGDEIIRSGAELFGNVTRTWVGTAANGFEALAAYDLDGDGMITENDPVFESLRLWSDDNRDGRSQSDEVTRLGDAGISAIGVVYLSADEVDANGNETRQRGVYFRGQEPGLVIDAWFHMLALPRRPV